jgi:hypothetical protein
MKKIALGIFTIYGLMVIAQEEKRESDTTKISFKKKDIYIIDKVQTDTIDASPEVKFKKLNKPSKEGHWGGIDFGPTILLNSASGSSFATDPQWENDPAKSFYWNINFVDHRFNIYKHYFGITTGFGVNFTQIGIRNNQLLLENADSIWVVKDSVNNFSKNKLRGTYLQIPLLLEFNTNNNEDKSFYLAAGVIGGVRVGSAIIQKTGKNKTKEKGDYGLNPFKLDATVRFGYGDWGLFVNYAMLPLFDTAKTSEVYPFTFGATLNF